MPDFSKVLRAAEKPLRIEEDLVGYAPRARLSQNFGGLRSSMTEAYV